MTDPTYTLRITRNGTKLATENFAAKITASQRSEVQAWLEGGSSPAQPDTQRRQLEQLAEKWRRTSNRMNYDGELCDSVYAGCAYELLEILAAAAAKEESNQ